MSPVVFAVRGLKFTLRHTCTSTDQGRWKLIYSYRQCRADGCTALSTKTDFKRKQFLRRARDEPNGLNEYEDGH